MNSKELRQLSETELAKMVAELKDNVRDLSFKVARRELKHVREIRETKKTIARILTLQKK